MAVGCRVGHATASGPGVARRVLKALPAEIFTFLRSRRGRRNLRVLARFFFVLIVLIVLYSVVFHVIMEHEGQQHSWVTGFYWTMTVMSTLGFGDITFESDLGRVFSMVVLLSGTIFMLVLLPFTFIEFFYGPWIAAQSAARTPRKLPPDTRGHVLLTNHDAVTSLLIRKLQQYHHPYALVVPEMEQAHRLHDLGLNVVVGDLDDPETWSRIRAASAALVFCSGSDVENTNVAFTVRGLAKDVPIIASASDEASVDILGLAGTNFVLRLEETIGQLFARRALGGDAMSHEIGRFGELVIAEANMHRTPVVGKTLIQAQLRQNLGVAVVGVWERGKFEPARPETVIHDNTVLVLAGSEEHLRRYDELFCIYNVSSAPVVILGGGRVGRATARALGRRGVDYRIVELLPERIRLDPKKYVIGNAAELAILEKAGIRETSTVIITPHDDDVNVYLTIYCRQLRDDIQILSRGTYERNVVTLHRAGADIVLSYASTGTSTVMNMLRRNKIIMVAEGLDLFEVRVPAALGGRTIKESSIRERTGCSVVAIKTPQGTRVVPDPTTMLEYGAEIVLIGTVEAEERFLGFFGKDEATSS